MMQNNKRKNTSQVSTVQRPVHRRLRGYSFDPSLSAQLDTALLNETVFKIQWEEDLRPGPVGEYLEIVDYDPASECFYAPVDLDNRYLLAQDGLPPSEGNPQFHQQMVYAVAMTTIKNFERALGRKTLWSGYRQKWLEQPDGTREKVASDEYIGRLRIYPHALRQANAYYSPAKKALLFGYFPATTSRPGEILPNGIVFTCLSHDIIAHETTHALLDGMHRRFVEATHEDTLAFHEAFADIVALFQHFTFPEVLKHQIAKTRGRLDTQNLLGELAQQFGKAIGRYGALRSAIGETHKETGEWAPKQAKPEEYHETKEAHARGAILVSAIFETFLTIYKRRVADLMRIASGGTGILPDGELHPDLVNRLASEASKTAQQILNMCIRALDYCPPVDVTFGDYLRAMITADIDAVPDDELGFRIALIDAFKKRGIYPRDIRSLSEESLCWKKYERDDPAQIDIFGKIAESLRKFVNQLDYPDREPGDMFDSFSYFFKSAARKPWKEKSEREKIFDLTEASKAALHELFIDYKQKEFQSSMNQQEFQTRRAFELGPATIKKFEEITGLVLLGTPKNRASASGLDHTQDGRYKFEVHSLRSTRRVKPNGDILNLVVISITQSRKIPYDPAKTWDNLNQTERENEPFFKFRGGCTLILNLQDLSLRYAIVKEIGDLTVDKGKGVFERVEELGRLAQQREFRKGTSSQTSLRATYFGGGGIGPDAEPFAMLHDSF